MASLIAVNGLQVASKYGAPCLACSELRLVQFSRKKPQFQWLKTKVVQVA